MLLSGRLAHHARRFAGTFAEAAQHEAMHQQDRGVSHEKHFHKERHEQKEKDLFAYTLGI